MGSCWSRSALSDQDQRNQLEVVWPLSQEELAWLRSRLADFRMTSGQLGFCLRRLLDAGALTAADLDLLAVKWRSRFLKDAYADETFSCVPAVVVFGIALAEANHPMGEEFYATILEFRHRLGREIRTALLGWYGSPQELDDLWTSVVEGARGSYEAILAAVIGRARLMACTIAQACDQLGEANPAVFDICLDVALAWGGQRRLWFGYFEIEESGWAERAEALALDATLSAAFRDAAAALV